MAYRPLGIIGKMLLNDGESFFRIPNSFDTQSTYHYTSLIKKYVLSRIDKQ
jgi:hypothetical protein